MACLEGYLKKRNTKKESKFLQNWNKRWFELTNQTLTYAKTPKDISAGSVQVYSVADIVAVNVKSDKEFEVVIPERALLLQAKDCFEMQKWMDAINDCRKGMGSYRSPQASPTSPLDQSQPSERSANSSWGDAGGDSSGGQPSAARPHGLPDFSALQDNLQEEEPRRAMHGPPSPRSLLARPEMAAQAFGIWGDDGDVGRPSTRGSGPGYSEEVRAFGDSSDEEEEEEEELPAPPPPPPPPRPAVRADPPELAYDPVSAGMKHITGGWEPRGGPTSSPLRGGAGGIPPARHAAPPPPSSQDMDNGVEAFFPSAPSSRDMISPVPPPESPGRGAGLQPQEQQRQPGGGAGGGSGVGAMVGSAVENWLEEDWDSDSDGGLEHASASSIKPPTHRKHPAASGKARGMGGGTSVPTAFMLPSKSAEDAIDMPKPPPPPCFTAASTPEPAAVDELTELQAVGPGVGRSSTPLGRSTTAPAPAPRARPPPPSPPRAPAAPAGTGAFGAVEPDSDWLEEDWDSDEE